MRRSLETVPPCAALKSQSQEVFARKAMQSVMKRKRGIDTVGGLPSGRAAGHRLCTHSSSFQSFMPDISCIVMVLPVLELPPYNEHQRCTRGPVLASRSIPGRGDAEWPSGSEDHVQAFVCLSASCRIADIRWFKN